jgi:hypothetical protein
LKVILGRPLLSLSGLGDPHFWGLKLCIIHRLEPPLS